eukprot:s1190_g25.t1
MNVPDYFETLFSMWDHGNHPADAAEFIYFVLSWMRSPCFSHRWGRFYTVENMRHQHDLGDLNAPIFLQVPHPGVTSVGLSDLIQRWTEEYGMQTVLLDTPDILICHIDRTAEQPDGSVSKLDFWLHADHVCSMPVLASDGSQVAKEYVPIALMAHLGDSSGGHFRAALRLTVAEGCFSALSTQHTLWALTDDRIIPEIHQLPGLPEWICRNITLVFLVALQSVDIYRPLRDPGSGWMRLRQLRQQAARNVSSARMPPEQPAQPADPDALTADEHLAPPSELPAETLPSTAPDEASMASLVRMMNGSALPQPDIS